MPWNSWIVFIILCLIGVPFLGNALYECFRPSHRRYRSYSSSRSYAYSDGGSADSYDSYDSYDSSPDDGFCDSGGSDGGDCGGGDD